MFFRKKRFLIRALNLNLITLPAYIALKKQADADFKAYLLREEEKSAKHSHLFTQIVLDAFRGGRIAPTQASSLLNTQVNNFSKLEAFLYQSARFLCKGS